MRTAFILFIILSSGCSYFEDEQQEEVVSEDGVEVSGEEEVSSGSLTDAVAEGSEVAEEEEEEEEEEEIEFEYSMIESLKSQIQDMKLDQAKLWTRMDRLERELRDVREKTHLLRKGLMTGIAPLGLSETRDPLMDDTENSEIQMQGTHSEQKEMYSQHYAKARQLFDQADYSGSYLEFSKIMNKFDASIHKHEPSFWEGRCWFQLKDYQKAKDHLQKFLSHQPSSPWAPTAHLEIAKSELKLGLQQSAVARLQGLINDHPYHSSTASAKMILSKLDRNL